MVLDRLCTGQRNPRRHRGKQIKGEALSTIGKDGNMFGSPTNAKLSLGTCYYAAKFGNRSSIYISACAETKARGSNRHLK